MLKRLTNAAMAVSAAGIIAVAALPSAAVAAPSPMKFVRPAVLGPGTWGARGGEPSIVSDGLGNIYVSAPQGLGGVTQNGVGFWISRDHGATWSKPANYGSGQGGGDSDLAIAPDDPNTIYIADLNGTSSTICVSHDKGVTFKNANVQNAPDANNCSFAAATSQYGYSSDRQWLTAAPGGRIYLTYHEFSSAQPLIWRDDKGGADGFADGPCGSIISDPSIEANMLNDVTAGSLVSKPVLDDAGNVYILITSPTQQQQADAISNQRVSPTVSQAYMAVSQDGCRSFKDYTVFDGGAVGSNVVQFGDDFNVLAIDGSGNLYAVAAGYIGNKKFDHVAKLYFFHSSDHGVTWNSGGSKPAPIELDSPSSAHMLPAIVGGEHTGEVAVGYFRTINGVADPNNSSAQWTYSIAESTDANTDSPHWTYADPDPGVTYHYGDICNSGVLCGTRAPGTGFDRSLADFTSATLDNSDCPVFNFAGNPAFNPPTTSPAVSRPTPAVPGLAQPPPPQKYITLPFVTRQQEPCFKLGGAQEGAATGGPSPLVTPSLSPTPVSTPSAISHGPLPNTDVAASRLLVAGSLMALFLLSLAARTLAGRRVR